jgi:hypothetical protein
MNPQEARSGHEPAGGTVERVGHRPPHGVGRVGHRPPHGVADRRTSEGGRGSQLTDSSASNRAALSAQQAGRGPMTYMTFLMNYFDALIASPMEQFLIYPIFSIDFLISNSIFYFLMAALISMTLATAHKGEIVATWWGILNESLYRTILLTIENYISKNAVVYFPLLYTVFHLILFSN